MDIIDDIKLVIDVFILIESNDNKLVHNGISKIFDKKTRRVIGIMTLLLILVPGTLFIIINRIDDVFALSLLASVIIYIVLLLIALIIYSSAIKYYLKDGKNENL